jgi:hypothetical protein
MRCQQIGVKIRHAPIRIEAIPLRKNHGVQVGRSIGALSRSFSPSQAVSRLFNRATVMPWEIYDPIGTSPPIPFILLDDLGWREGTKGRGIASTGQQDFVVPALVATRYMANLARRSNRPRRPVPGGAGRARERSAICARLRLEAMG